VVQAGAVIRAAAAAITLVAVLALGVPAGQAADECRGLQVCIPVAGPWVKIPAPGDDGAATATWNLVCPDGVVGGVDARASEAGVAVEFPGLIGSPVNPGITTSKSLLFKGTYAGRASRPTSYRPFIGCIPGGGGGPRTPTALVRADDVAPGKPITVRVATLRVENGSLARTTLRCRAGERLLSARHSVGLYTPGVPTNAQLAAVHVVRAIRGGRVLVSATRRGLAASVRAEVQIQAECAK
jgi:hypothetical protein